MIKEIREVIKLSTFQYFNENNHWVDMGKKDFMDLVNSGKFINHCTTKHFRYYKLTIKSQ